MKKTSSIFIVGKVGTTYGIHGWVKIQTFTEFGPNILNYHPWLMQDKSDAWQPVEIEDDRILNNNVLVKFVGFDTPEAAKLLTGKEIAVERDQLPVLEPNEYYWSDLKGLTVINQNGDVLGTVNYLMETGSNDVLVVKGEKEWAIPYLLNSVIVKVDLEKQEIHVNWEEI